MLSHYTRQSLVLLFSIAATAILSGCGAQPSVTNANLANSNANSVGSSANSISNTNAATSSAIETKEPEQYQAKVTLTLEAIGGEQKTTLPTLTATVARNSTDRRMEFAFPVGGSVVFLDKAGTNYLILPAKKQ